MIPEKKLCGLLVWILFAAEAASAQPPCPAPALVISGAALIERGRYLPNREVVIQDRRILAIGQVNRLTRPAGARVIDARGDTLFAGLIDAHAHMYELGGPSPRQMYESPRENSFPITGRQLLRSGVTTARVHLFD